MCLAYRHRRHHISCPWGQAMGCLLRWHAPFDCYISESNNCGVMRLLWICLWHVNSISPISVFIRAHHCCSLVNESLAHQHDSIPNEEPRTQVALDKWAHFWHHGGEYNDDAGCVWGFETDVHLSNMISVMESIAYMEAKCIHDECMPYILAIVW